MESNCIPINPYTKMPLPFDNEIPDKKVIIEVHGKQHYEETGWHITQAKASGRTPTEEFEYQKFIDTIYNISAAHKTSPVLIPVLNKALRKS